MTIARREVLVDEESVYHCVSRCVRRAYLCGFDRITKRSFEHRRGWIRDRLRFLVQVFCVDVLAYALLSNHQHLMLRTQPKRLRDITAEEIAIRWLTLYPTEDSKVAGTSIPSEDAVLALAGNARRIGVLRARLGSISWFMKCLSESVARRANTEDDCTGRFWEGRFKCQRICDEAALLTCSLYIDLNPIRAKVAQSPELSEFTSAWERIGSIVPGERPLNEPDLWIAPIQDTSSRRGFLRLSLEEYLALLDETGRRIRTGKRGAISPELRPILERLGIRPDRFIETATTFGRCYSSFAGKRESLETAAKVAGRRWVKGLAAAELAFT